MRKHVWLVVILAALPCAEANAQVNTGATIDSITVTQNGNLQQWTITMKGTVTLGTNCTLDAQQFSFTDPNGNKLAVILKFVPPPPGKTANYTATLVTQAKGKWNGGVSISYTDGKGVQGKVLIGKEFNVP